jgi:hypothetical protein
MFTYLDWFSTLVSVGFMSSSLHFLSTKWLVLQFFFFGSLGALHHLFYGFSKPLIATGNSNCSTIFAEN